jgi:hypothetical protein
MPDLRQSPLSRDRAWACVMLNISLPGLGSWKAGKFFAGVAQLTLAFAGFFLVLAWMLKWFQRIFQAQFDEPLSPPPAGWLWESGAALFVFSFLWTVWTCISLMREAKANEIKIRQNIPPRLDELGKPPKLGE